MYNNCYNRPMISNYHTHTKFCKHADALPYDYIAQANKDGCTALGFSDHCPYPHDERDTWSNIRMKEAEAPEYLRLVREAAKDANFPVFAGFECEWHPMYASWYKDVLLEELACDYLIHGPHWVFVDGDFKYAPEIQGAKVIKDYFINLVDAIQSKIFTFVAHPDLIMAFGREWSKDIEDGFTEVINAAYECGIPLEINGLGLSREKIQSGGILRYQYPVDKFWEMAGKKGVKIVCNADAHKPQDVIVLAQKARDYADERGLQYVETLPLVHRLKNT